MEKNKEKISIGSSERRLSPISVFDSGYGGLTILREIRRILPEYDYVYLGDNARSPYGSRSFEVINEFTMQAVDFLWKKQSPLTILACNTASAKALRVIQQKKLPVSEDPTRRILGVIRPTVEVIDDISKTKHIGVFATQGTVSSNSYKVEIAKLFPHIRVTQIACPMWVPLVEYGYSMSRGVDFFVEEKIKEMLSEDKDTDTIILGCTHYPIIRHVIERYLPSNITLLSQGELVAYSLKNYLRRHEEIEKRLSKGGTIEYLTTECSERFSSLASLFVEDDVNATRVDIVKR